ncbi:hypothetical protein [Actinomadura parmotrematis]|uniref:RNA polymerase alpha subunit C-terminal domain-containing protein n=1 Tax=Actinomadura parmotrematis TaxID=2864039 RepID=A0ABS7FSF2_9ACTN|nr:hypothetical protein [Actinomadura parmotrematis]MBW8483336.1 hypothetical protein [Actinomadura parmotrematis]
MKLHRRVLRLDGRAHTVVGLRPGTAARFSTNRFHETWHVLSDDHGAALLGRLLWGLAYQARPGTLVVIDRPFLVPTPFDADPPDPVVLLPAWCTSPTSPMLRDLARRLPLRGAPDGTVRWRTHGLDRVGDGYAEIPLGREEGGRVERRHGLLVFAPGTPDDARLWGSLVARMDTGGYGTDHRYLGAWGPGCSYDGEVQIFREFARDVGRARRARAEVLARRDAPADAAELRPLVWRQQGAMRRGTARRIENCRGLADRDVANLRALGVRTLDDLVRRGPDALFGQMAERRLPGVTDGTLEAMRRVLEAAGKVSEADRGRRRRRR